MIRAPLIQHTAEIRKNMALADLMIVTAAFMKWPFRLYLSFDNDRRFRPPATSFGHGVYNERSAIFAQRCAPHSHRQYKPPLAPVIGFELFCHTMP